MSNKNYYEILGVDRNATAEEISKKYKKLALQYHPDRHVNDSEEEKKAAEEKFKEIAEAYSVIGDEEKRRKYDMGESDFDAGDIDPFEEFARRFSHNRFGGFGFGNMGGGEMRERGRDLSITFKLTLEEAYSGVTKKIKYKKNVACSECHGTGSADGKLDDCPHCHGTGRFVQERRVGNSFFQNITTCPHCNGTGKVNTTPCKKCKGSGYEQVTVEEEIVIPAGVDNDMVMNIPGKGSESRNGGPTGYLIVGFDVAKGSYFERNGGNLVHTEEIPLPDAILGCEREIKYIDGTKKRIKIPELTKDNTVITEKGKGMPIINPRGGFSGFGDYNIIVKYVYPKKLNKEQRAAIETLRK